MIKNIVKDYGKNWKREYKEIYKLVEKHDRIVVFRHIKPDYDALGSQMGLVTFLKDNFPSKDIHFVGDNHVSFSGRLFPESEKLPESYFEKDFLAFVLDVGDVERIADPRFQKAKDIVKIDHHPCKADITEHAILDTSSAAAGELVANLLLNWKGKRMSKEAAKYLYMAIVGDSGRFMHGSTSKLTFNTASHLLETGIDIREIYLSMYEKKLADLKVTAYILNHFSVSPKGVAYYLLPKNVQEELFITSERGKDNVNLFSNIEGINAWCSITEDDDPKEYCWRISIRSKKKDISGVARKWGGGGHAQASGSKIPDLDHLEEFIKDLDDLF